MQEIIHNNLVAFCLAGGFAIGIIVSAALIVIGRAIRGEVTDEEAGVCRGYSTNTNEPAQPAPTISIPDMCKVTKFYLACKDLEREVSFENLKRFRAAVRDFEAASMVDLNSNKAA